LTADCTAGSAAVCKVCVCVCAIKFGISVYSPVNHRMSPSLNGNVSLGIDSKREESARLVIIWLPDQRGPILFILATQP